MKKIILNIIVICLILVSGVFIYSIVKGNDGFKNTNPIANNETKSGANEVDNKEIESQVTDKDEKFNVETLVLEAFNRFWNVRFHSNEHEADSFIKNDIPYIFLDPSIDTIDKLLGYLLEVYTEDIALTIINGTELFEEDGRLYKADGGIGTLMNWAKGEAILIEGNDNEKIYEFNVPAADDYYNHCIVSFKYIHSVGWRVNSLLDY